MSRRKRSGAPYSLFPFLNVLACLMGALTLMIGASAFGHMGRKAAPAAAKRTENIAQLQQQLSVISAELGIIGSRKEIADQIGSQLSLASAELESLRPQLAEHKKRIQAATDLEAQLKSQFAALEPRVSQLQSELERLSATNQSVQTELARRAAPAPDPAIQIRPSAGSRDVEAVFVECRSNEIVLYNEDQPRLVPAADVKKNATFLELLDKASKDDTTVIFLVRNDGISTYFVARDVARSKKCHDGKLPIVGQGNIDLSLVKKGAEAKTPEEEPANTNGK